MKEMPGDTPWVLHNKPGEFLEIYNEYGVVGRLFLENGGIQLVCTGLKGYDNPQLEVNDDGEIMIRIERRGDG